MAILANPLEYQEAKVASLPAVVVKVEGAARKAEDKKNIITRIGVCAFVAMKALISFKKGEYAQFDALVGDTACQIRALRVAAIAQRLLNNKDLENDLHRAIEEATRVWEATSALLANFKEPNKQVVIGQIMKDHNIDLLLPEDFIFLTEAYLLCHSKDIKASEPNSKKFWTYDERLVPGKMTALLGGMSNIFPESKAKEFLKEIQKDLANRSIKYIQEQGALLPNNAENALSLHYVKNSVEKDEMGRPTAPCIYMMDIIYKRIMAGGLNLLVQVKRYTKNGEKIVENPLSRLYGANSQQTGLVLKASPENKNMPVFVVAGICVSDENASLTPEQYFLKLEALDINKILLSNWASHCHYAGRVNLSKTLPLDQRVEDLKAYARSMGCYGAACEAPVPPKKDEKCTCAGCSLEGLKIFATDHIYCDTYEHATEGSS